MSTEERRMVSLIQSELLNRGIFPSSPFKKHGWCGLVYNRDRHGVAGLPKSVFDAALSSLVAVEGRDRLFFVPAVFAMGNAPTLESTEISSWNEYLATVNKIDFFPEYYLVTPTMSFLIWVDPDAAVIGGESVLMEDLMNRMGGRDAAMKSSAADFDVDVNDADSLMAAYIRAVAEKN